MKIFNTLTRYKEELIPIEPGRIKMYACGPTVYNYIHIGNARPVIFFDTVRRYLEYKGYDVKFVQNFTDIDDKIIKRANEEGIEIGKLTEKYINAFFEDTKSLNIKESGTTRPKATEYIKEMIGFGASPRASINLALAARAYAFVKRRGYVIPEDIRAVCHDVLRHRIGLTYEAEANNLTTEEIISEILNKVEVP